MNADTAQPFPPAEDSADRRRDRTLQSRWTAAMPSRMMRIARLVALTVIASMLAVGTSASPASAQVVQIQSWPTQWRNPFTGQPGGTVNVSTIFGAYSKGCANWSVNGTADYQWYLNSGYKAHLGMDLAVGLGDKVYAVGEGTVIYSGQKWGATNGDVVLIESETADGSRFVTTYGHIVSAFGRPGNTSIRVSAGQYLGTIMDPGLGAHLHFGIKPGSGTTEMSVIEDARITGSNNCSLAKNTVGMADPIHYLRLRARLGGTIAIKAVVNDRFVTNQMNYTGAGQNMLRAAATSASTWEQFRIDGNCRSAEGCAFASLSNNRYVSVEMGTEYSGNWQYLLRARADRIGSWERFQITGDCVSQCTIKSLANGRYWTTQINYGPAEYGMERASATVPQSWEQLRIVPL